MSLMNRLSAHDPVQLIRLSAAFSLALTDVVGFSYNFALMLFGVIAMELSSTGPEQFFITMVAFLGIFDILSFMTRPPANVFHFIIAVGLCVIKAPIYFSGMVHLRERGGDLSWPPRGFGVGAGGWIPTSMGGGGPTLGGQTVGGGGPTVGGGGSPPGASPPPGAFPSGGYRLGGQDVPRPPQTRDGYSAIA